MFSLVTQDRSQLSSRHVKVSGEAEAGSEHDDIALTNDSEKTLEKSCRARVFFMGLSLVIKFHITEVFCSTLLIEMTLGA